MSCICNREELDTFIYSDFLGNTQLVGISFDDWISFGGTAEMLSEFQAQMQYNPANYLRHDEMGNAQLVGISFYEYVAIGGHPDDFAPSFESMQAEQEVLQDMILSVG